MYNYLVINYLGKDLEQLFQLQKQSNDGNIKSFSPGFCAYFMTETIPILSDLHKHSVFHCDVKPSNFIFNAQENKIYLIDFSVAQTAKNINSCIVGTPKFCSIFSHDYAVYSPRDDLISLGYVMLYFYLGYLPWQKDHLTCQSKNYNLKKIKEKKSELLSFLKTKQIPEEFNIFFNYSLSLTTSGDIDYKMLYLLFARMLKNVNYTQQQLNLETRIALTDTLGHVSV